MAIACPACKTPMKDLFTGVFCPNDCDKPKPARRKFSDIYALNTLQLDLICDKVPADKRDELRDVLCMIRKGDKYEVAWNSKTRTVLARANLLASEIMQCDWMIYIGHDGKFSVVKNRFGLLDIDDIPDMI